ncbi:ABC transporter transmembrane domain-containing protein [Burkholderia sp. BCC0419]|uniref:ABC transporter transmembrane domain-containing protein n=1 Tax=Burkholderia sp. BCC0419 TaxID=486878 RepID=UPI001FC83DD6|nr:ABC transporter transmembrane domain-containing protein [Burkholderia sp. BCC0419]
MNETVPECGQMDDQGLIALVVIAQYHGIAANAEQLRHAAAVQADQLSVNDLELAARSLGLKVRRVRVTAERLTETPKPALMLDEAGQHFVLAACDAQKALIVEAGATQTEIVSPTDVIARTGGQLLLLTSRASLAGALAHFDFSWFVPAVVKYRRILLEVLIVSAALQVFALVSPLMFQVVMDKVLVNRAFDTLNVVCVALLVSGLFEILLSGVRNYVFAHTASRIDVELGAKLFRHLLTLPLAYFGVRRVGDTVARVRELENIRSFLTGQALTAVIDLFFSIIFLAVMCVYSVWLTLVVVVSLPVYAAISILITPILRKRLDEKFARTADNQSFLVETVSGVETVKAMAIEPQFTRRWDNQLAGYVAAGFRVTALGNVGQQLIQLVGKLVSLVTLYLGARFVIEGKLSVGQLVAFNMMSQHVAAPVLRLAQLWQDFQQVGISMSRLGDILNTRTELAQSRQTLPAVRGNISFQSIRFRYRPDGPTILDDVSLDIAAGEVVGIVGRSAALRNANELLAAAQANQLATLQTVFGTVARDFYAAQAAQGTLAAAREVEQTAKTSADAATARTDRGVAAISDQLQAQTAYADAVVSRTKAESDWASAIGKLASDMNLAPATPIVLPDVGDGVKPDHEFGDSVASLIEDAQRNYPGVAAAVAQVEAARAKAAQTRAEGLPRLNLVAQYNFNNQPTSLQLGFPVFPATHREWYLGFQVTIPFFEGFVRTYQVRQAEAQTELQVDLLAEARQQVGLDVWNAYQSLQGATKNLDNSANLLTLAQHSYDAARRRYQIGVGSILELLNAQSALANAKKQRIQALTDWRSARLQLASKLGKLGMWNLSSDSLMQIGGQTVNF